MKQEPNIHIGSPAWGCDFFDRQEIIMNCTKLHYYAPRKELIEKEQLLVV
jgi:hypothetical protein